MADNRSDEWDMHGRLPVAVAASSLATVFWSAAGVPRARGVVALRRGDHPALAFTYADAAIAHELAAAGRAGLALTETRGTGRGFRPMVATGRTSVLEDREGAVFVDELLDQELRKFPPARLLADSALLRREHWWYLPRLIVDLHVEEVQPVEPAGRDHVLVTGTGPGSVQGIPASVVEEAPEALRLDLDAVRRAPAGPALLFGQDAAFPELERWAQWGYRGVWDGERLAVHEAPDRRGIAPVPGILARWRRQRSLERACRQALSAR